MVKNYVKRNPSSVEHHKKVTLITSFYSLALNLGKISTRQQSTCFWCHLFIVKTVNYSHKAESTRETFIKVFVDGAKNSLTCRKCLFYIFRQTFNIHERPSHILTHSLFSLGANVFVLFFFSICSLSLSLFLCEIVDFCVVFAHIDLSHSPALDGTKKLLFFSSSARAACVSILQCEKRNVIAKSLLVAEMTGQERLKIG